MKKYIVPITISLLSLAVFLIIAYYVSHYESLPFDVSICQAVYAARSQMLTVFFKSITYTANWQTISLICIVLLFFKRTRKTYGYPLAGVSTLSLILYTTLKGVFARPRPDITLHLIYEGGFSFPSGHSMTSFVFYGFLAILLARNLVNKRKANQIAALLCILIFLVGFSRVYLGVHYPTDVLGGFFLGNAVLFLILFGNNVYLTSVKKDIL